jgi:acetyl esterase/lipase
MNIKKLVGLILLFMVLVLSTPAVHSQSPTYSDIPYVPDGTPSQVLDIYLPETGVGPFPTILEFRGGGSGGGGSRYMRSHFLEQGYALVGVDYNDSDWGQGVKDGFCALAWLHTEGAEYNLDATRTIASGFSLGGLMVSYLGTVDDPNLFLVDCPHTLDDQTPLRGVIEVGAGGVWVGLPDDKLSNFTGFPREEVAAMRESIGQIPANEWADTLTGGEKEFASRMSLFWLDGSEPPFLLAHGEIDYIIPTTESIHFAEELEAVGSPVELVLLPGVGHVNLVGFPTARGVELTETVDAFLEGVFEADDAVEQQ